MILEKLLDSSKRALEKRRQEISRRDLAERIAKRREKRSFLEALKAPDLSFICEFKRRSPSAGAIALDADLSHQVKAYERAGAAALSVLTDAENFSGSLQDLSKAERSSRLPILCKDFIIDPYQILEAAAFGADAILLIARILPDSRLSEFQAQAAELELDVLLEVHDEDDLARALVSEAKIIGINNRDLDSNRIDLETTIRLGQYIPRDKIVVSESGLSRREEIERVAQDVDAILLGEALMQSKDPEQLLLSLQASH